jgi:hypothetical protein
VDVCGSGCGAKENVVFWDLLHFHKKQTFRISVSYFREVGKFRNSLFHPNPTVDEGIDEGIAGAGIVY